MLNELSADLDLHILSGAACDPATCVVGSTIAGLSPEVVTTTAMAGVPLVVLIEGWSGAVSDFTLSAACETPLGPGSGNVRQPPPVEHSRARGPTPGTSPRAAPATTPSRRTFLTASPPATAKT